MYLKLIERDGGGFSLIEATSVLFRRHPEPVAICDAGLLSAKTFSLCANAYVLNERGATIETFYINGNGQSQDRKADRR